VSIPKKARLTNKLCRELPFSDRGQYVVRDAALPGFLCVVGARTRTYTLQIDVTVVGKRKTIKRAIGSVERFDASAARQEAQRLTAEIRTEKSKHIGKRSALTLRAAWQDYARRMEARVEAGERSRITVEGYRDYIERGLSPWLDVSLREIGETPEMVAERHKVLTRANGPVVANRIMTALRAVYNNALKKRLDPGLPPHNPVSAVDFNREERRSTGMGPYELWQWAQALRKLPNAVRQEFHLFTLLSAMRPDALKRARWEHLDVNRRVLHVPSPKGGEKRAFDLPLSRDMLRSLWRARKAGRVLHSRQAREWIFPAATPSGHIVEHKEPREKLSHWGGDLRQTWRTAAQIAGLSELDCSLLMNHSLGSVNAGYISTPALREHLRGCQEKVGEQLIRSMNDMGRIDGRKRIEAIRSVGRRGVGATSKSAAISY
jgi:integrase